MLASFVALLGGLIVPMAAPFIALPAYALLSLIIVVVEYTSSLPFAALSVPAFPFVVVIIAYAFLAWLVFRFK
jgi:hypothetical protein